MSQNNLYKGFEVELFTGSLNSHIGVSTEIEKQFPDFVKEPDNRNVEYITIPEKDYNFLYKKLITPRKKLRKWLNNKTLTIIPSSTLCFKHDIQFQRSDIDNVYHQYIQDNYGISIATSSVHINIGIDDLDKLFTAITIRTMIVKPSRDGKYDVSVQAGAGIVADSFPENEYQETINKAKGILKALACLNK